MSKKILVTSVSSWNQKTGSDTLSSLFASFDSKDIANIYILGDKPDSNVCSRYFHINEISVVKSVLNRNIKTGEEVTVSSEPDKPMPKMAERIKMKRLRIFLWARELAWKLGRWKSKELENFLENIKPEVLVFPIENYPYFNRLNLYIINKCNPQKIIGYLWDDNFTYKQKPYDLIFKVERFFRRKRIRKLIGMCTEVFAISPKMKEECDNEFGINSIVLTKPIFKRSIFQNFTVKFPIHMLYTGKLIIGREKTIAKLVAAIKDINKEEQKIVMDVYTQTILSNKMRKLIDIPGCCVLHKPVPQSEIARLQKEADVLVFAEALSSYDLTARLSFSTKLTDYFAAGKCVWGIGNADLGPIDYIKTENAGFISTNEREIEMVLNQIVSNPSTICDKAKLGYECGLRNHNADHILQILHTVIES